MISKATLSIKAFETDKVTPMDINALHYKSWQAQTEKPFRYDLCTSMRHLQNLESGLAHG